jgi:hypothetical protein
VASKGASAARNTVALITTLGLASGIDYAVDIEHVSAVLKDQQLMDKIKRYRVLLAAARAAEADVRREDRALQSAAKPAIRVVNQTGFATPVVLPESLDYSFAREVAMGLPATLDLTTPDPFGAMQTLLDARKAALLSNRTYRVSCPRTFSQGTFRGTLSCSSDVTERDGTLTPQVVVTLESISEGLRFPDYEGRDKNLAVSAADNALVVANLTTQYLEVQSIAIYGGKDIQENPIVLSLAPEASNREPIPLRNLASDAILRRFRFDGVRKADLQRREHFAIAVKYRLGDGDNFKTFLGGKDVLLADVVRTR